MRSIPVPAERQAWKEEGRRMCRPNAMMKQKFLVCLTMALLLALTLFGAALAESAATIPEVNVVLSQNTNAIIQTANEGLDLDAKIGVYVTGENTDPYNSHGRQNTPFGTYFNSETWPS